jgi:UDPglucose 6-dehydrogenase
LKIIVRRPVFSGARSAPLFCCDKAIPCWSKSTVPVGTARQVARIISQENPSADFDVVSNPEFLREGAAINDFMRPERIVIGSSPERASALLKEVYKPLYLSSTPFVVTGQETAANICEAVGADVKDLAKAIGLDGRIGGKFLHPGPGYGGSCFSKDTMALLRIAQEHGASARIVEAVVDVNGCCR